MKIEEIWEDFNFMKGKAKGVLLFGSSLKSKNPRDIDVCIVSSKIPLMEILKKVGGKYDVKIMEDLPLPVKIDIVKNHRIVIGNESELSFYFYHFWKLWEDNKYRIEKYSFSHPREMLLAREKYLKNLKDEKKAKVS